MLKQVWDVLSRAPADVAYQIAEDCGMRTISIIGLIAVAGYLAYIYGPGLLGQSKPELEKPEWAAFTDSEDTAAVKAGLGHLKGQIGAQDATVAPKPEAPVRPEPPVLRRKEIKSRDSGSLQPAPKLKAVASEDKRAKKDQANIFSPGDLPIGERNFSDPMGNRWIESLSGHKVKMTFSKSRQDMACEPGNEGCDRFAKEEDARVVGVVMDTDRMKKTPLRPIEGTVKRGHFVTGTPAVYVK